MRLTGQESGNLPVDAKVNLRIGSVNVDDASMVDEFFDDESRDVEAYHVGIGNNLSEGGDLEINVKVIHSTEFFQALSDLFFKHLRFHLLKR